MSAVIPSVVLRSYIAGLTLSNDGTSPNTVVDIAAGQAADSGNAVMMNSSNALTVNFAATGANALDTGTIAASTWYHVFLIAKTAGNVAGLASLSLTPALPGGYTYYRRLGSVKTDGSSHILAFAQDEETFYWAAPTQDVNSTTLTSTSALFTLSVPTGVKVRPLMRLGANNNTLVTSPDEADLAPATTIATTPGFDENTNLTGGVTTFPVMIYTNTASQIRARCAAGQGNATFAVVTRGWIDTRGRFA